MKITKLVLWAAVFCLVLAGIAFKLGWVGHPWARFEKTTLNPGFRSPSTPADLGLPYQHLTIQSDSRKLDAFYVAAPSNCVGQAAVLIFHGRGETIAEWIRAQQRFHDACIASLAFDYSGHGRSDGPGNIENLNADGINAYREFVRLTPNMRRCLFSHSMGGGPMLWTASDPETKVDCVVAASPFSSLTSIAERGGLPKVLGIFLPDVWDNAARVRRVRAPLLWIHSFADQTIPIAEGQEVFSAAPEPKCKVNLDGFGHNAIYKELPPKIWLPMIAFIKDGTPPSVTPR